MSRSSIMINLRYAMLDGNNPCVPGFEDSSGGHTSFTTGWCKMKVWPHSSSTFDEIHCDPYDRDACVKVVVAKIKEQIAAEEKYGDPFLTYLVGNLFDQAKAHCDEAHQDLRAFWKAKAP